MVSRILNALIFLITASIVPLFFRKDGQWSTETAKKAFRFFTVLSNVFCAVTALLMCLLPDWQPAWLLKYLGTAAVALTMVTVLVYLGPAIGYGKLLARYDFFLHLFTPLLAIVSFCFFEKRGMGWGTALLGVIPMLLYAFLYLYHVVLAPEPKRWEDFYGFNRGGHWKLSFAAMLAGMLLICFGLMALQNA
ncbi:MAG: hypothetical protein J5493_00325 [Lachnospiraceae bacterium]|nr:hypothetical protein [Lachnospiraceae bacterium]